MLIYVSYLNTLAHVGVHILLYHYSHLIIGFLLSNYNICNLCLKLENEFYQWFYIIIWVYLALYLTQILCSTYFYYYYLSILFVFNSSQYLYINLLYFHSYFNSYVILYYLNFIWRIAMIRYDVHPFF